MPAQAAELERLVIVAGPFEALQAAKASTSRVPIIMTPSVDPAVAGIVASLDHPGGNITGITEMMPELATPRFALLKEIVPGSAGSRSCGGRGRSAQPRSRKFSETSKPAPTQQSSGFSL